MILLVWLVFVSLWEFFLEKKRNEAIDGNWSCLDLTKEKSVSDDNKASNISHNENVVAIDPVDLTKEKSEIEHEVLHEKEDNNQSTQHNSNNENTAVTKAHKQRSRKTSRDVRRVAKCSKKQSPEEVIKQTEQQNNPLSDEQQTQEVNKTVATKRSTRKRQLSSDESVAEYELFKNSPSSEGSEFSNTICEFDSDLSKNVLVVV